MDRPTWIKERQRIALERMDHLHAPVYDVNWGNIAPTHEQWMQIFLDLCPSTGLILDAACGTGKYWPMILSSGRKVFGLDYSQGMLDQARVKFPQVPVAKIRMQDIDYAAAFDGAICMDVLESVFPEDWLMVLTKLQNALRPSSYLYFTVELMDEAEIEAAYQTAREKGLPVVYGEWAPENRYHYYPKIEQVKTWVQQAGFRRIDEAVGDDYHHFLVKKS